MVNRSLSHRKLTLVSSDRAKCCTLFKHRKFLDFIKTFLIKHRRVFLWLIIAFLFFSFCTEPPPAPPPPSSFCPPPHLLHCFLLPHAKLQVWSPTVYVPREPHAPLARSHHTCSPSRGFHRVSPSLFQIVHHDLCLLFAEHLEVRNLV